MKKIYDLYNGKYDIAELSVNVTMAGQTNEKGEKAAVLLDFVQITFTFTGFKYYLGRILFMKGLAQICPFLTKKKHRYFWSRNTNFKPFVVNFKPFFRLFLALFGPFYYSFWCRTSTILPCYEDHKVVKAQKVILVDISTTRLSSS